MCWIVLFAWMQCCQCLVHREESILCVDSYAGMGIDCAYLQRSMHMTTPPWPRRSKTSWPPARPTAIAERAGYDPPRSFASVRGAIENPSYSVGSW